MRFLFVDTSYWIAVLHPRDRLHERAQKVSASLGRVHLVTSEMVLTELLNDFSKRGLQLRRAAVALIEDMRRDPNLSIVPQSSLQFQEAFVLYAKRADKTWSHTDCASFQAMKRQGISEALTHDRHFEQAGFRALLRD